MTDGTQSPTRDGAALMSGKKADTPLNLRHKVKLATWNVMTLAGTGYEVALIRELARLKLP